MAITISNERGLSSEHGETLSLEELMQREAGVPSSRLQELLHKLSDEQLITQDVDENWLLKRDLSSYTLQDLYVAGDYHLPIGKEQPVPSESPWDAPFLALLGQTTLDLDQDLASLYDKALAVQDKKENDA